MYHFTLKLFLVAYSIQVSYFFNNYYLKLDLNLYLSILKHGIEYFYL